MMNRLVNTMFPVLKFAFGMLASEVLPMTGMSKIAVYTSARAAIYTACSLT